MGREPIPRFARAIFGDWAGFNPGKAGRAVRRRGTVSISGLRWFGVRRAARRMPFAYFFEDFCVRIAMRCTVLFLRGTNSLLRRTEWLMQAFTESLTTRLAKNDFSI
ncbi:hypothetical protein [Burkholderia humptydooensis]|uniref:hypothetical protein n=1 Tax=Burkholderia humptydooensis TaxID=430531 RepID=UPI0002D7DCD2|nr:hypothetical protein [Burkholderia humptydooensis]